MGVEQQSTGDRIARAGLVVQVAHVLFKVASIAQVIVATHFVTAGLYEAVYVFAFEGFIFSLFLIGEEVIGPSFLPVFMRETDERGETAAWRFANIVLSVQFLLLLIVVTLVMCFPGAVTRLITEWSEDVEPEKFRVARNALFWLAPALVCLSLGSTTYMILNGYKRFFLAAFGDASWKLCVLLCVLIGMGLFGLDYRCLVFGLLAGSAAKLGTHLLGMLRELRFARVGLDIRNPAFRRMLILGVPLVCGIVFAHVRDIFNNVWVLSSLHTEGLMQANSVGRKLYGTVGWLVPYAFSIAMFPFFCELVDRDDKAEFARVLSRSGRMLLSVFLPFVLVCVALSSPLTRFLFQHGQFTAQVARWTSLSMACYVLVLPAFSLEYFLMQAFFAHRRMVSVTVTGIVFSSLSVLISYLGIVVFGATGGAALAVIALGFAFSRTLKTLTLVILLRKNVQVFPWRQTWPFLLRALLVALVTGAACYVCTRAARELLGQAGRPGLLAELAAGGAGALAAFVLGVRLCRLEEPGEMLRWALAKLGRGVAAKGAG